MTVIDNFDSYSDGDLNGQGSWSGSTNFDVQGTTVYAGAKAVSISGGSSSISKTITAVTQGIVSVRIRGNDTPSDFAVVRLLSGATAKFDIYLTSTTAQFTNTSSSADIGTVAANTWYLAEIEVDHLNQRARGRWNGGAWSAWLSATSSFTSIDGVRLQKNSASNTVYFDEVEFTPPTPPDPDDFVAKRTIDHTKVAGDLTDFIVPVKFDDMPSSFWDAILDTTLEDGLTDAWRFVSDSKGDKGHNGTDTSMSYSGGKAVFNGSSSFISIASSADFNLSANMTFVYKVNADGFAISGGIGQRVVRRYQDANNHFQIIHNSDGTVECSITRAGSTVNKASSVSLSAGVEAIVVIDYTGTDMKIYINNVDVTTTGNGPGNGSDTTTGLFIGKRGDAAGFFDGSLDFFYIYHRSLTSGERTALYNSGTGTEAIKRGGDIRVFKSDGVTELPREIVSCVPSVETVSTYYFDAGAGTLDPTGSWSDDANAFDGSTGTFASALITGSQDTKYLLGAGTSAPTSGGTITQVRVRHYGVNTSSSSGLSQYARVYTSGLVEFLGESVRDATPSPDWSSYVVLDEPSGGWTWAKIRTLEVQFIATDPGGVTSRLYKAEIEVTHESIPSGELHFKYTGTLSSSVDTEVHFYADGVSPDYAATDTYGRNAVWSDYAAVWHMESSPNDSKGVNNLTNNASTPYVSGKLGNGADFESGSSQYFSIADASQAGLEPTNSLSITAWIKPESIPAGDPVIIAKDYSTARQYGFQIQTSTSKLSLAVFKDNSTLTQLISNTALSAGSMYHVGMTYTGASDNAATLTAYLNGAQDGQTTSARWPIQAGGAYVGVGAREYSGARAFFDGVIDELRFRSGALSANWVATEYNALNDPTTFSIASSPSTLYTTTLTEAVVLVDSILRQMSHVLLESVVLVATVLRNMTLRALEEGIALVATVTSARVVPTTKSEELSLADEMLLLPGRVFTEAITLVDNFTRQWNSFKTFAEEITLEDLFSRTIGRAFEEAITLVDRFSRLIYSTFTETVTVVASFIRSATKVLTDAIIAVDTMLSQSTRGRLMTEAITLVDRFVYTFTVLVRRLPFIRGRRSNLPPTGERKDDGITGTRL